MVVMTTTTSHIVTAIANILAFVTGGKSTFTLRSTVTGSRFTYKITRAKISGDEAKDAGRPWFVKLMTGTDNETSFSYMGCMFPGSLKVNAGRKSKVSESSPGFKALVWFLANLEAADAGKSNKLSQVEFWHEGRCGCCGRKLTVPESLLSGIGPDCAKRLGIEMVKVEVEAPVATLEERSDALVTEVGEMDPEDDGEGPDPEDEPERRALATAYASTF